MYRLFGMIILGCLTAGCDTLQTFDKGCNLRNVSGVECVVCGASKSVSVDCNWQKRNGKP